MSRTVSSTMLQALQAQEIGEAILVLVKIDEDSLPEPIRVCSDAKDTVSNGNTFVAFPFEFVAPEDTEDGSTRATITIDNVDRQIVEAVRTASSIPKITVQVVRASDPDTIEVEWPDFDLLAVDYDQLVVTGQIGLESYVSEPFPKDTFTPNLFNGVF